MSDDYIHDPERVDEIIKTYRKASDACDEEAKEELKRMLIGETIGRASKMLPDGTFVDELSDDELIERWADCWDEDGISSPRYIFRKLEREVDTRELYPEATEVVERKYPSE